MSSAGPPNVDDCANPEGPFCHVLQAVTSSESATVTADLLENAPRSVLLHMLPLLLSKLQFIGEAGEDFELFQQVISTFRQRLIQDEALRVRFLLHVGHPSFSTFWRVADIVEEDDSENRGWMVESVEEVVSNEGEEEEGRQISKKKVRQVVLNLPTTSLQDATLAFWREGVYCDDSISEGAHFDTENIVNPLFRGEDANGCVGEKVRLVKEFSSIARPRVVNVLQDEEKVFPGVLVKAGDNLMLDGGVMHMFQTLNWMWRCQGIEEKWDTIPIATWYDVVATATDRGILQGVEGLTSLKKFSWDAWCERVDGDEESILEMVRSAAGGYVATYIIGGRDRHFDNIMILNGEQLVHIDFTYILGGKPLVDAPKIAIASEMEEAFKKTGVWDIFLLTCGRAMRCAHRAHELLGRVAELVFEKAGEKKEGYLGYIMGHGSLDVEADEDVFVDRFVSKVASSSEDCRTWMKRIMHETVDPVWYNVLKSGFPPATFVMGLLEKVQGEGVEKMAKQEKEEAEGIEEDERLRVDE